MDRMIRQSITTWLIGSGAAGHHGAIRWLGKRLPTLEDLSVSGECVDGFVSTEKPSEPHDLAGGNTISPELRTT